VHPVLMGEIGHGIRMSFGKEPEERDIETSAASFRIAYLFEYSCQSFPSRECKG